MTQYMPMLTVIAIIFIIIFISVQYTLNLILKELRAIRLSMGYDGVNRNQKVERNE